MEYLHDSRGRYVGAVISDNLFSRTGRHVGRWLPHQEIFVDLQGRYLGEIVDRQRLLHNKYSKHVYDYFGVARRTESVGHYEDPGRIGIVGLPSGYADVDPLKLG